MQGCSGRFGALIRLLLPMIAVLLGGCLEREESADTGPLNDPELEYDHELTGSVGDGPIVGAMMRVLANNGTTIASFESDSNAGYNILVRTKGKFYPLTIDARSGTDLVTNLGPDVASGTVTLVGVDQRADTADYLLSGTFSDLLPGASTTIVLSWATGDAPPDGLPQNVTWTATVNATGDTNPANDVATAVSKVVPNP